MLRALLSGLILVALAGALCSPAAAASPSSFDATLPSPFVATSVSAAPGAGLYAGHTRYRIDIDDPASGGIVASSLLEFPVRLPMFSAGFRVPAGDGWLLMADILAGSASNSGRLADSDWILDAHEGLDIYSESRLDLNRALIWQAGLRTGERRFGDFTVALQAGYRRQSFAFTAVDLEQVGFGPYESMTLSAPGPVLEYAVVYHLPYLGFVASSRSGRTTVDLEVAFSPLAGASDVDDHLLRAKRAEGESTGMGWVVGGRAEFQINERVALIGSLDLVSIRTSGGQYQYFYYPDGRIEPIAHVRQWLEAGGRTLGLKLLARF